MVTWHGVVRVRVRVRDETRDGGTRTKNLAKRDSIVTNDAGRIEYHIFFFNISSRLVLWYVFGWMIGRSTEEH